MVGRRSVIFHPVVSSTMRIVPIRGEQPTRAAVAEAAAQAAGAQAAALRAAEAEKAVALQHG